MSYAKTLVPIPSAPHKITRKPLPSGSYVYLEVGRTYNSETHHTTPKRQTIGKLEDKFTGKTTAELQTATHMYPNSNYFTLILKNGPPEIIDEETEEDDEEEIKRSNCLLLGPYVLIKHLFRITQIKDILDELFPNDAGFFMDLAAYSIICESNVAQHYPDYCYRHPLFTDRMRIFSDSTISRFLRRITRDNAIAFQDKWNEKREKTAEILLTYDETNKNTKAQHIEKAEISKAAKDNDTVPIVNYAVAYDISNYDPLFYEDYPGSIPDVSQLDTTITRARQYGYQNITFILDRGYFSEHNINSITSVGYSFIIMAKGRSSLLQEALCKVRGTFERDRGYYYDRYHVYGTTCTGKLYESDQVERYIHVFYHDVEGAVEREKINREIKKCSELLRKLVGKPFKQTAALRGCERFFDLIFEPIPGKTSTKKTKPKGEKRIEKEAKNPPPKYILKSFSEKNSAINAEYDNYGYFEIISDKELSAETAITHYKGRDRSEKLFLSDKTFLGNSAYRVYCDEAEEAKTFIEFVASIIRNRIFHGLSAVVEANENKANRLTVPSAIAELEKIEIIRTNGQPYKLDHAVSATQKIILGAFGLTADSVVREVDEINKILFPGI